MEVIHGIALQKDGEIRQVLVASQDMRQVRRALVAPRGTWQNRRSSSGLRLGFMAGTWCRKIKWEDEEK